MLIIYKAFAWVWSSRTKNRFSLFRSHSAEKTYWLWTLSLSHIPLSSQAKGSGQEAQYIPAREQALVIERVVTLDTEPGLQNWLCVDEEGRFTPYLGPCHDDIAIEMWRQYQATWGDILHLFSASSNA